MEEKLSELNVNELLSPEIRAVLQDVLKEDYNRFVQSGAEPFTIRINTLKTGVTEFLSLLNDKGIAYALHPDLSDGVIIKGERSVLTRSLAFFRGDFVVQGLSSQLPVRVLDPQPDEVVLDMAASPGSKSTQIAALMHNRGKLLLCDPSVHRQQSLLANLLRAGVLNDVCMQIPGQRAGKMFFEYFDRALVDAPCSAFSKIPEQLRRDGLWNSLVVPDRLHNTQYHLLVSAIKAVKPGGVIVYSTCTLPVEENERLIDRIICEYPVSVDEITCLTGPSVYPGFTEFKSGRLHADLRHTRRIMPYPEPFEAFYIARLRKTGAMSPFIPEPQPMHNFRDADDPEIKPVLELVCSVWGIEPSFFRPYRFLPTRKKIWMIAAGWEQAPAEFFVKAGIPLAECKGRLWKLTTPAVQLLGHAVTRTIIRPDERQMRELFATGSIPWPGAANGYYALEYAGEMLAAASIMHGILKVSLPQTFDV
ncbi:MAG TPA: RsmB/NOP family class I SAM-dependent RNA methyltransferase [bacterium]|nr:RsmB/NOP family class I SAM-dependent RNA methyltransferase [bacterium]HPN43861.1 RsmB/NOP family class I SAM-dependent RNA methyltransferase [bacterium]